MAMTENEQRDLRTYCAFLLKEYGFHFSPDDPVIPALYIIHKEMQRNNQSNKALGAMVKEAASQIHPKEIHFNVEGEAWNFQMGITIRWIAGGILVLLLCVAGSWHWSNVHDIQQARLIIQSSGNINKLRQAVKKEKSGSFFIDFTSAKGDSVRYAKDFVRINSNTVRVYLGKGSD